MFVLLRLVSLLSTHIAMPLVSSFWKWQTFAA